MFSLRNISKSYNEKTVLENIDLAVNSGEVVALIGENGAGKTTLLKILLGAVKPDEGDIALHNEIVGYVPQEPEHQERLVKDSFGITEQWRIDYVLSLVMLENTVDKNIAQLSGGQKTRLALAQVLAQDPEPTVLLLDEPTNNIDQDGLQWLRFFIKKFNGAILLVSHDRSFINEVATSVVELHKGTLKQYGGDYDFYKQQKEIEYQSQLKEYEKSIEERKQLERVLREKQERASKGLRNQKMRDNDKQQFDWHQNNVQRSFSGQARAMQSRIDQLSDAERPESLKNYAVKIASKNTHDKKLIVAEELGKTLAGKSVLHDVSFEVRGGERWHIQGLNGAGKSTLLKMVADLLRPDTGEIKKAEGLKIEYFSQDVDDLPYDQAALAILEATHVKSTDIYRQARSMGLGEEDLRKKPHELSRGQQAKLTFTKLLLGNNDLLILDEPTNHLDISTKERLEVALSDYQGTLLVASHDRYFIKMIHITHTLNLSERKK